LSPDIAKKPLVSLEVNVPVNWEPSDIVTVAVESTVPAGALSVIVALAGDSVIAVGVGTGGGGGGGSGGGGGGPFSTGAVGPILAQAAFCRAYQLPFTLLYAYRIPLVICIWTAAPFPVPFSSVT